MGSGLHIRISLPKYHPRRMGWMNYFGISHTYREVLELDSWMRRRVRLYYWPRPR